MRSSCRFAMAVHVLAVLAYKKGGAVTSSFLAQSVNTNPVIIRRLLLTLQKANLVETRKGAGYGSSLKGSPGKIRLSDIYRAVEEEDPFVLPRQKPNENCPVGQCIQKALSQVFTSAEEALESELSKTSLADILGTVKGCVEE